MATAVGLGLVFDLFTSRPLGLTSIYFLTSVGLLTLYRRKFQASHPVFVAAMLFLNDLVLQWLWYQQLFWRRSLFLATLGFILYIVLFKLFNKRDIFI